MNVNSYLDGALTRTISRLLIDGDLTRVGMPAIFNASSYVMSPIDYPHGS